MSTRPPRLHETAFQTAGPYVHIGLAPGAAGFSIYDQELGHDIAGPDARGDRIRVAGRVFDGAGAIVTDALLEVWQANADGHYPHPAGGGSVEQGFRGWGRTITDFETGEWRFDTVKPGPVRDPGGLQAPHLNLWLVARGVNVALNTRMYFSDEDKANAADPVLIGIEPASRRRSLIGNRAKDGGRTVYSFDIILQGENETVFFDF